MENSKIPEVTTRPAFLVFCDLDGTLVLDNSFHVFMSASWTLGSFAQRTALAGATLPRVLGRLSGGHAGLKKRVLKFFAAQPQNWRQSVVDKTLAKLAATQSRPVTEKLDQFESAGGKIVLATAAPDVYARPLATLLGYECLATSSTVNASWIELLSDRKAMACQELISDFSGSEVCVLTDHPDDLPLLALADSAVIQASGTRIELILSKLPVDSVQAEVVDPTVAQEGGGFWLWMDDRPHGPLDEWEVRTILSKHRHALLYEGCGKWRRAKPGMNLHPTTLRVDCPQPPSSKHRVLAHVRRRLLRDILNIFH